MNVFRSAVTALFKERHSTTITVTLPTQLLMALETLVYLRNETSEGEVDRDYLIGVAVAQYLQHHLVDKNEAKIADIPPAPDEYTSGRRQARST